MKQVFTSKTGILVKDAPEPAIKRGFIKIKVSYSCISAGTEMSTVKGSNKSILQKAIEDPSKILQIVDLAKSQGLKRAKSKIESANEKITALGYSVSGQIIEIGEDVQNFEVGEFVSAGGGGFAVHAGVVVVPQNLVVKVPRGLNLISASIGTVGSIAMHGVRRANLNLGEYGVVFGVGLLGLLALQIFKASGVKVACVDIDEKRLNLADGLGADKIVNSLYEDPVLAIKNWTSGYGADGVLFTAATNQDEPLSQAFKMCRKKGKVVLVGVSGMNINRDDIFKNEIDFLISTSYGPGRYDNSYELEGNDYPYAYVRWTENRNIASFLDLVNDGKIDIDKLAPKIYPVDEAGNAYIALQNDPNNNIISILDYAKTTEFNENKNTITLAISNKINKEKICIGLIGAGSFATSMLLPIISENKDKFHLKTIVNSTGDKAFNVARQFKAENASSNVDEVLNDPEIDLIMICTRHNNHADLVLRGLQHNKHVYVEKPLATTLEELLSIEDFYKLNAGKQCPSLMVGFNRRFSIYAQEIKTALTKRNSPVLLRYRMNAGFVPYDNWVHQDGGRIVGEACHLIDLMQYLTGAVISECSVNYFQPQSGQFKSSDNRSIALSFDDGSIAIIDYFSCGSQIIPKENLEVHFENKSIIMDDYKLLTGYGVKIKAHKSAISQKGHKEEWVAIYNALKRGDNLISIDSLIQTTKISILASK